MLICAAPVLLVVSAAVTAQSVSPQPRKVVSFGPDEIWIRETAVAHNNASAGNVRLVASWITQDEVTLQDRIGYAISDDSGSTWSDKYQGAWRLLPMPQGYNPPTYFAV